MLYYGLYIGLKWSEICFKWDKFQNVLKLILKSPRFVPFEEGGEGDPEV